MRVINDCAFTNFKPIEEEDMEESMNKEGVETKKEEPNVQPTSPKKTERKMRSGASYKLEKGQGSQSVVHQRKN